MNRQGLLVMFGTAAVTTAFTVMLLAPSGVSAVDAVHRIKPVIAQPQLTTQGCTFVLKTDKAEYDAGETPAVELKASNPTDKPVQATIWVNIAASAPVSPMARMLPVPKVLWSYQIVVSLNPGENRTVSSTSDTKLPAGQNIQFSMTDKARAVLATSFAVKAARGTGQAPNAAKIVAVKL